MRDVEALAPVEFRFTGAEDVARYGDRWFRYSEAELIRLPARALVELEAALDMPVVAAMNGMRMGTVLGDTAVAWIGIHVEDPVLAGSFADFNPLTMMIEWRASQDPRDAKVDQGKDQGSAPSPGTGSPGPDTPAEASAPTATVVLPSLPVAE